MITCSADCRRIWQTELDTCLFASDELNRELQDEQDSLIEDFVYSQLTPVEDEAFQAQCARSPTLQEKVKSFRVFLSCTQEAVRFKFVAPNPSLSAISHPPFTCAGTFALFREFSLHTRASQERAPRLSTSGILACVRIERVCPTKTDTPLLSPFCRQMFHEAHPLRQKLEYRQQPACWNYRSNCSLPPPGKPIGMWNCCTTPKSSGRPFMSPCIESGRKPFSLC